MNSFRVKIHPNLEDKSKTKIKSKRIKLDLNRQSKQEKGSRLHKCCHLF